MFHLARTLGRTVRELQHTLTVYEFAEWAAFLAMEHEPGVQRQTPEDMHAFFRSALGNRIQKKAPN